MVCSAKIYCLISALRGNRLKLGKSLKVLEMETERKRCRSITKEKKSRFDSRRKKVSENMCKQMGKNSLKRCYKVSVVSSQRCFKRSPVSCRRRFKVRTVSCRSADGGLAWRSVRGEKRKEHGNNLETRATSNKLTYAACPATPYLTTQTSYDH